jgi:hypothetical protein
MKILLVEIIVVVALFRYVHSVSHWLTDSNKNSKSSLLLAFSIIKNILPLVEGVMVDDHTLEKEYHPRLRLG